jgi:hypothetical protein
MIEQIAGRVGNRWDFSVVGDIVIIIDDSKGELFIYKDTDVWYKYYSKYINKLKELSIENPISLHDLRKIRTDFFENNDDMKISYKKLIKTNLNMSVELLKQIVFSKGSNIGNGDNKTKFVKDTVDVRGDSMSRFFAIQIDGKPFGTLSGPINLQYHIFGDVDFSEIRYNQEIIKNARIFFEKNPDIAEKYGIKNIKRWKDKGLFRTLFEKAKCSETPFPLLVDYGYNHKIGYYNKKKLDI